MKRNFAALILLISVNASASAPMPNHFVCSSLVNEDGLISNYRVTSVDCRHGFSPVPGADNETKCSYSWENNQLTGTVQLELVPGQPHLYRAVPLNGTLIRIDMIANEAFITTSNGFSAECR